MIRLKLLFSLSFILALLVSFLPRSSQASCIVGLPIVVNLPDIILTPSEKGTPGTVLYTIRRSVPKISYSCGSAVKSTWRSTFARPEFSKSSIDYVYNTGIAGIGIRIKWPESRAANAWVPGSYQCQGSCVEPSDTLLVQFVQTGNSQSGVLMAGELMRINVSSDDNPAQQTPLFILNNSPVTVQIRSCSIISSSNYIELGEYSLADVTKSGFSASKKNFSITLNCPNLSSAKIQFDGINAWGETPGVLKSKGDAENVHVKLYSQFAACSQCYSELELNKQANFGSAASFTGTRSVNYAAEMYFNESTRSNITAGNVEASVVFTLTIN